MPLLAYLIKLWKDLTGPAVPDEIPPYEELTYDKVMQPRV